MFDIDLDDLDAEDAEKAGQDLEDEAWNVRRDACKALAELSDVGKAEPHMPRLKDLAANDPDYEVKKAARKALQTLREKGAQFPAGPGSSPGPGAALQAAARAYSGPKLLLRVFKEVLPMRLECDAMTPVELTELWETQWGVQFAGRIKFEAPEGSEVKWLNPREDVLPLSPSVVTLHVGVGSILLALATALKNYGMLTLEEVQAERVRKSEQLAADTERRQEAEPKEQERLRQAAMMRKQERERSNDEIRQLPFVGNRELRGQAIAGLGTRQGSH